MFATMDPAIRARALRHLPGKGFEFEAQINHMLYTFDPMWFGAESYRHWSRQTDGAAYLRRMIAGEIAPDLPP